MLFTKILTAIRHRPGYLYQYTRGTFVFFSTHVLNLLFLNRQRIQLHPTVRTQSLRNFLAASEEAVIKVGAYSVVYEFARLEAHGKGRIDVGEFSILGDIRIVSREKIQLGKRLLTSWNVLVQDFDPHPTSQNLRALQVTKIAADFFPRYGEKPHAPCLEWAPPSKEIIIGDDVWLGANAVILKGSKIGSGSIVAAGSVVTGGEFPERSLIAGNPARLVKELPQ